MSIKDYKLGLTGNYYYTSKSKEELKEICFILAKSNSSIYWSKKYKTFCIRVKNSKTKELIKSIK